MLDFQPLPIDEEPAASLVAGMRAEIAEIYEGLVLDGPEMPSAGKVELGPPGGTFLVGYDSEGAAVCGGGVKDLGDGACEIKRMYVVSDARRRGYAGELLIALENAARDLGYEIARLDTGPRQPHAEAFYRSQGYAEIANFNANPVASFWGEKRL